MTKISRTFLNKRLHICTGLPIIQMSSICAWIFNVLLSLIYKLMFQLRNFILFTKNVPIIRHIKVFGFIFLPVSQKNRLSKRKVYVCFFTSFIFNLKHSYIIGSLRNYEPLKHFFRALHRISGCLVFWLSGSLEDKSNAQSEKISFHWIR